MIKAASEGDIRHVAEIIGYRPSAGARGIQINESGQLSAMVIYDRWSHNGAEVHIYSPKSGAWLDKKFLREVFSYPFHTCGKEVLVSVTPGDAEESLAVSKALGFVEICRVADYWKPGVDMVIKEMRKENCRWLPTSPNQPASLLQ